MHGAVHAGLVAEAGVRRPGGSFTDSSSTIFSRAAAGLRWHWWRRAGQLQRDKARHVLKGIVGNGHSEGLAEFARGEGQRAIRGGEIKAPRRCVGAAKLTEMASELPPVRTTVT